MELEIVYTHQLLRSVSVHEKLDLHKFTRGKYGANKCKLGGN